MSQWELLDVARAAGVAYPLRADEVAARLERLENWPSVPSRRQTLPDVPPKPGGILLVGINPAPASVAAGHYYQGRLGRRLWRRLERLGLLHDPLVGAEDEAFARAGHGLTDLVKRPARSSADVAIEELRAGAEALRAKINEWKPGLVLFAFKEAARQALGQPVAPGHGPDLDGVPTFLLTGPYAPASESERIDAALRALLRELDVEPDLPAERTQRVTNADLEAGRIRLPRPAKRLFPSERTEIEIVLRGTRTRCSYDPRYGPDRERSAVLRLDRQLLRRLVRPNETLGVSRGAGGVIRLQ